MCKYECVHGSRQSQDTIYSLSAGLINGASHNLSARSPEILRRKGLGDVRDDIACDQSISVVVARAKRVVNLAEVAARQEGQTGELENSRGQSVGQRVVLNANDHSQMVSS